MPHFESDHTTIEALEQLTTLIEMGLEQAWDPAIVETAKKEVENARNEFQTSIDNIHHQLTVQESQVTRLKSQAQKLELGLQATKDLEQLIEKLGGAEQLSAHLASLQQFKEILPQIQSSQLTAERLEQQSQQLQRDIDTVNTYLAEMGGAQPLLQRLDDVQKVAEQLQQLGGRIQDGVQHCLDQYLPTFEEGKAQISAWRSEVLNSTNQSLIKIDDLHQKIEEKSAQIKSNVTNLESNIREFKNRENTLKNLLETLEQLAQAHGGEELITYVSKKLAGLDQFIQLQVQQSERAKADMQSRLQTWITQETEKAQNNAYQEINRLTQENHQLADRVHRLEGDLGYLINQVNRLQSIKCDRPVWLMSNLRRPH
jgi:chromosome segregation ATPase